MSTNMLTGHGWSSSVVMTAPTGASTTGMSGPPPGGMSGPPPGGMSGPAPTGMSGTGGMMEIDGTVAAYALSGLNIFNGLDATSYDAVYNELKSMDACLSHSPPSGDGHYHSWSPCITKTGAAKVTPVNVAPGMCTDKAGCVENFKDYSLSNGYLAKSITYIGLAKDGHMVVGPYNEKGELWSCEDVDMCNGVFLANGNYVYAGTGFFPYILGCFGPA